MTTEAELQDLSRRAAGCLPADCKHVCTPEGHTVEGGRMLHDSNGACAQIMVRVLFMQHGLGVRGHELGCYVESVDSIVAATSDGNACYKNFGNDPMLAYRVAVLKALCALKEGK